MTTYGGSMPIMEEDDGRRIVPNNPSWPGDAAGDGKLEKSMSLEEALRIIRGVAEHNTREIPSPGEIAEAMGRSFTQVGLMQEALEKMRKEIARATGLMDEMQIVLSRLWALTEHADDDRESAQ